MTSTPADIPAKVLSAWPGFSEAPLSPITLGHINATFRVDTAQGPFILQRLHPVFGPEVNLDIAALAPKLVSAGVTVPQVVPTRDGNSFVNAQGACWRVLSFLPGRCVVAVESPAMAASAGALAGRFHAALCKVSHAFQFARSGVHDTPAHLATLKDALAAHPHHPLHTPVAEIADALFEEAASLPNLQALPSHVCHGDLKISNFLFDDEGRATALIDLDTLGQSAWCVDLADALRSWCNSAQEDAGHAVFEQPIFEAALAGYVPAVRGLWSRQEERSLVPALLAIALELTARFAADALNESYFGWNADAFPTRGAHNLARARGQWDLHRQMGGLRKVLEKTVARSFKADRGVNGSRPEGEAD
jgi:Ser/Thr protein kinase RdoA (MazF antagonist)